MFVRLGIIVFYMCLIQKIRLQSSGMCGGYFTNSNGYFTSNNYTSNSPNTANCYYYIIVPNGYVRITITDFLTQSTNEYLKIYDGNVSDPLLVTLIGTAAAVTADSTFNKLTLHFRTDGTGTKSGFQATYTSHTQVNGNWGSWSSWSTCSKSCGNGIETRTRMCNSPAPSKGGLNCKGNSTEPIPCLTTPCPGDLRLRDGPFGRKGRLEIFFDNQWGTVCADSFGDIDAVVACRQLGYSTGFMVKSIFITDGTGQIWFDDIGCSGTEYRLDKCKHNGLGVHNCEHVEDVGVECFISLDSGTLRIIEEKLPMQGRLEVYTYRIMEMIWGTICDHNFDDVDAMVACKQMGYSTGVTLGNSVTDGSGGILLGDVNCTGTEFKLTSCSHGLVVSNCNHSDDVGVQCFIKQEEEQTAESSCCSPGIVAGIVISCIVLTIGFIVTCVCVRKRLLTSDGDMKMSNTYNDVRRAQVVVTQN